MWLGLGLSLGFSVMVRARVSEHVLHPSRPTMFCCDQMCASSRRALPVALPFASLSGLAPGSRWIVGESLWIMLGLIMLGQDGEGHCTLYLSIRRTAVVQHPLRAENVGTELAHLV